MKPASEIARYYEHVPEETRLTSGAPQLEFERTKDILARVLPPPPARIVDVGGAAGAYSLWLAQAGYAVHLLDTSARLVAEARRRSAASPTSIAAFSVADARALPCSDTAADGLLLMGPLYHLQSETDRLLALREARRVLRPSGVAAVAGISRFASALDGLAHQRATDPAFVRIRDRDLRDGHHLNDTPHPEYFTTAYFHRPDELRRELERAGFRDVRVLGVEGPAWILDDFDTRWSSRVLREDMVGVARAIEDEASIVGASAHLLAVGRR